MLVVWILAAGLGGIGLLVALYRFVRQLWPESHDEELPATPLERLGWIGLWITVAVGLAMVILVAIGGATDFYQDDATRGIFTVVLLVGVAAWFAAWHVLSRHAGSAVVDERDRAILARSFSVESVLVILSLVAWTVSLTEVFWDEGAVPIGYLQLIFWSTFILGAFGRSLGIVLGYRREPRVDA
jgi:MFS family permease